MANELTTLDGGNRLNGQLVPSQSAQADAAVMRQAQEVKMAMQVAKMFPRDETQAFGRIMQACKRKGLAEQAMYAYPRGGSTVTGPSIRLAEMLAQNWGNIDFGIIELAQRAGESDAMAYAWDLETNTRQVKVFVVKHERHKKGGVVEKLKDSRDIYELVANNGARRLRACILGIIPGDIQDSAIDACEATLKGGGGEPLIDRVRKMVAAFQEYGVTSEMIEKKLGHKLDACVEQELVTLRKIFVSLKDGMSKREQWFDVPTATTAADKAKEMLKPEAKSEGKAASEPYQRPDEETMRSISDRLRDLGLADDQAKVRDLCEQFGAKGLRLLTAEQAGRMLDHLAGLVEAKENDGDAAE